MATTIEVLAAYYAHELTVQHQNGQHYTLIGLEGDKTAVVSQGYGHGKSRVAPTSLTPCLLPFEELCTPLEDRTVPAVEVAKIQWPTRKPVKATWHKEGLELHIWVEVPAESGGRLMRFVYLYASDLQSSLCFSWKAAEYLRRHHFAVGLTPEQFIRKTAR